MPALYKNARSSNRSSRSGQLALGFSVFALFLGALFGPRALSPLAENAKASPFVVSNDVVISQVYGGGGNSSATYTHDFIELFNRGNLPVSLNGWSVQYTSSTGTGNFGASGTQISELPNVTLQPGQYYLIQEASNAAVGAPLPTADLVDATPIAMAAGAGKVALATISTTLGCNGGSTACTAAQLANIKDLVGYGTGTNFFEGGGPTGTISATNSAFRNSGGCVDTDNNNLDFTVAAVSPRNTSSSLNVCDGPSPTPSPTASPTPTPSPSPSPIALKIHDIQGNGTASPFIGVAVKTTGVVTAKKSNGFFLQEPDASVDADPNTSEGVFVFTSAAPTVSVGDFVDVMGTATEFFNLTEINVSSIIVLSTGNSLPTPVVLTPTILNPSGPFDQLEKFEGMRVSAPSVRSVAPTNEFGEIFTVLNGVARPFREPGIDITLPVPPDPTSGLVEPGIPRWDRNPERIMIDTDGLTSSSVLNVTSNVTLNNIVGPLDFNFGNYKVDPEIAPVVASPNMTAVPVRATIGSEFSIAGFNIENFGNNATQRQKAALAIRTVMNLPDVIGTIEILDLASLQALADQVNNDVVGAGGSSPGYTAFLIPAPLGGSQNVGYLVKTSRVQVDSVTQERGAETYTNPLNGNNELLHDRPPLVLKATVNAATDPHPIIVVVNHLRSFIDIELVGGDGLRVRAKRKAQSESLAGLLQELQTSSPGTPVISVGDYNAYQFSDGYTDPIATIKGMPTADEFIVVDASPDVVNPNFINLTDSLPADQRYSFIFEGTPQALDHVIVNNAANSILQDFKVARMNSDFSRALLGGNPAIPEGNSDHDSPVAYFKFTPSRVVDNLTDDPGLNACTTAPGDCSLRGAISSANDGDTITFDAVLFLPEALQTIVLGGTELLIDNDVTITGPGAAQLAINASGASRVMNIAPAAIVNISGLTITGGNATNGGGIFNGGTLSLTEVVVDSNIVSNLGGGIYNRSGTLTIVRSTVSGNTSAVLGGGIENLHFAADPEPAVLTVINSTIAGNTATSGAGIHNQDGTADLRQSTISGNSANSNDPTGGGGGFENVAVGNAANTTITGCTFNNNSNSDPTNAVADDIYSGNFGAVSTVTVRSTILAGDLSTIAPNLRTFTNGTLPTAGVISSGGFNLSSDGGGGFLNATGDMVSANPQLGPLQNNGGPTQTHKPATGFPGHDKGCGFGSTVDQRGMPRTVDWPNIPNGSCDGTDIGSLEILVPTAGGVVVAGRVVTIKGIPLSGVRMILSDADGNIVEVFTNAAGFYVFDDVPAGETYTLTPQLKLFTFTPRVLTVEDNMEDVNFIGQSNVKRGR